MWFKFIEGEPIGRLRVKQVQTCWYDMEDNGDCFDEDFIIPVEDKVKTLESIGHILTYVETVEDENNCDRSRVFIHMDDGSVYELLMKKLSKEQFAECTNFHGGRGD